MSEDTASVEIPHEMLSPDALIGVIENYVLREGTDYGAKEFTFEEKVAQVREQLARKEAWIVFDPESESVTLVTSDPLRAARCS
jgi:uncharacterized protein